ncbi:MAG: FHA domain-containing protein [Symploca sp. SIO2C1]|nr:FHA domain-containing protein [Symploca sp. SIO2C1]
MPAPLGRGVSTATPFTIGREPSCSLVIEDTLCSRYHAQILQQPDPQGTIRYQLIDIGSSNGTFVNGQKLVPHQPFWLTPGNVIRIGNQEWAFEVSNC